ncbi:TPA: hypothetical protein HL430_23510 [Escherichia coli]|nr:hypothetical protein [Escherichia coli]
MFPLLQITTVFYISLASGPRMLPFDVIFLTRFFLAQKYRSLKSNWRLWHPEQMSMKMQYFPICSLSFRVIMTTAILSANAVIKVIPTPSPILAKK